MTNEWETESYTITKKRIVGRIQRTASGRDYWFCSVSAIRYNEKPNNPSTKETIVLDRCNLSGIENAKHWVETTIDEVIS